MWILSFYIEIYWLFPRLPFGIVAYANLCFFSTAFVETAVFQDYVCQKHLACTGIYICRVLWETYKLA